MKRRTLEKQVTVYVVNRSVESIFWGLFKSLVGDHIVFDGGEDVLQGGGFLPVLEEVEVLNSAVALVDAGQVAFIVELEDWRGHGVVGPTLDVQTVNPVFEVGLHAKRATL